MEPDLVRLIATVQIRKKLDKINNTLDYLKQDSTFRIKNPDKLNETLNRLTDLVDLYEQSILEL